MGEALACCNHRRRKVHRINTLDAGHEVSGDCAGATPGIEHHTRFIGDETGKDGEGLSRIGNAMAIGCGHASVLKLLCVFPSKMLGLGNHE